MGRGKHLRFLRHLGQFRFKMWLDRNASQVLSEVGIGEGDKVLDFGSGSGTFTIPAAKLVGNNGGVYALDVSRRALNKLDAKGEKEGLDNIVTLFSSGEVEIALSDRVLDHVLLIDVLQEIPDKKGLLDEVNRIMKSNGIVTVYPMHIDAEEVVRIASDSNLKLKEKKFQERVLVFEKKTEV